MAESDQIVAAMTQKGITSFMSSFPTRGMDFARPENGIAFKAIMEAFLGRHLGGRAEPIGGDFAGVRAGVLDQAALIEAFALDVTGTDGVPPSSDARSPAQVGEGFEPVPTVPGEAEARQHRPQD